MDKSERLERMRDNKYLEDSEIAAIDSEFASRILALLNHPQIDKHCMVDAYYYDFSVIPRDKQIELNLCRDCYMIYGITTEGDMITKWVERWDLDSEDPVVDGKVVKSDKPATNFVLPEIKKFYDPKLLSTPFPQFLDNLFGGGLVPPPSGNMEDTK